VYSIADAVLLRPLPYPHPERLMWVAVRFPEMKIEFLGSPDYVAWRRDNRTFENLAATQPTDETMLLNGENAAEVHTMRVSANFLKTLGVRPALGRDFTAQEELPNGPKGILLTNRFWERRFGRNASVVGKSVRLDGQAYRVNGILPRSFVFPTDAKVDVLTTLPISPAVTYNDRMVAFWHVYGRLKPGVTAPQARADLEHLFDQSRAGVSRIFSSSTELACKPLQQHRIGDAGALLYVLTGSVTCLLLIACANVSNLLLARWSARSGELAIRAAIGAGRRRLTRQLLTEAALLTLMGCASGMLLVFGVLRGFVHYAGNELPRLSEIRFDGRVFAIGLLVSLFTTLLFGGLPAWHAGRLDIQTALQRSGRFGLAAGYSLAKRALIAGEAALCLILLSGAALLLQTLWHLRNDRLGFEPEHILAVSIPFKGTKFESGNRDALVSELLDFARHVPGTEYAAQTECTPLSGGPGSTEFSRSDRPLPDKFDPGKTIHVCGTGAGYAKAAGIRVLAGRFFSEDDFHHPNTLAVINETAARTYFPGEDAIGKQIIGSRQSASSPIRRDWKTVIGVVSDSKNVGLNAPPGPQAFINAFTYPEARRVRMIIRSIGKREALESALSGKLRSMDSGLTAEFEPISETIAEMSGGARFNALLVGSFAVIAFFMAVIGVYGVLAFAVAQRTQEIGIRMALGSARGAIFRLLLREGMSPVFIGIAAGVAAVLGLTRYVKAMLYGVSATDPATFAGVAIGLVLAAGIAIAIPARRASRVDPTIALRHQ
jgi:putative ABC transport system permease protein